MTYLADIFNEPISGEWGEETEGEGTKVIRTTNFTNSGKLDLSKGIALRSISDKKVAEKRLQYGDVIIEKSGGSPAQPVGRVVFFDIEQATWLCNNFTAVLRPKQEFHPRYCFYLMYCLHKCGAVLKYQNKTTGIINLKLNDYLKKTKVSPLPPLETQKKIAAVLDKAQELIDKRTDQLAKMDEFVQSVFLEIFGDVDVNPNGWNKQQLKQHLLSIDSGWSPNCNDYPAPLGEWGVLKLSAVTGGEYKETENKALPVELQPKGNIEVHVGDLLVTRKNTRQLVGACAYVMNTQPCLMLPDTIFRFNTKDSINKVFLWKLFNDYKFKKIVQNLASGSAGSMPNISKGKLMALEIPLPPLDLQIQFAAIIEKTEQQKALMQQSLAQMENNMSSLMQRAFKGELF